ncbi:alpha/beta fold hydrolase [Frankia sp. AgB1.9]|uniref:alpha/beta fold hydrolase n=1 Tax=unclassified Frankia TaxID=2632575 RepID=UPI001932397D|nr:MULTISPECIES: alpha/beta fold hydrolase [unclassified Frankia]MBL7489679.1 alpha/beta fold hydrolase [Frankia sp. AgW1.1]MBL7550726.1 alpha/beta fold hydrolase [Frankia sp. AgB1.9]MBL7624343.1 alpha/beta fold hydrolase [Frankia sp. AgB1.8]
MAVPTVVLIHGAGDTADVWQSVQASLGGPSVALDLVGRGQHPADLAAVTLESAVQQALRDIEALTAGPLVLVAHSMGGALSPGILRSLGSRVVHLVHIAAVAAADGELPLATASREFADNLLAAANSLRAQLRATSYADPDDHLPDGLRPLTDPLALTRVDSLNLGCVPTSWAGVAPDLPRTFIQPLHDRLYPAPAQRRLAAAIHAHRIRPLEAGHNAARSAPEHLAHLLDDIAWARDAAI